MTGPIDTAGFTASSGDQGVRDRRMKKEETEELRPLIVIEKNGGKKIPDRISAMGGAKHGGRYSNR